MVVFPFPPNMVQPVVETFGYQTDIITSFRGMEQRIQLRAAPIGSIAYSILLTELRDAQMAGAILFGGQAGLFGVGRWQFQVPLLADAEEDDLEVLCDTVNIPFEEGGLVLLCLDPYHFEYGTIESVAADRLTLTAGLVNAWTAARTAVIPLVEGRLSADENVTWNSLTIASQTLVFDLEGFRP